MHEHLEIVMPPTDDIEAVVAQIMEPFNEQGTDEDGRPNTHGFWDYYRIGGRFSGSKIEARLGRDALDRFRATLLEREATVSSVQFGKQSLMPASQIPVVDALWRDAFPNGGAVCPLFDHSGDRMDGDVCVLGDLPDGLTAARVIVAGPRWDNKGLAASTMVQSSCWNGVTWLDTQWDGTVATAIEVHLAKIAGAQDGYRLERTPTSDWLVVTVDYHS